MKKMYIGLDIGTESCGFAATDENYNLLRHKGKDMWGVRRFDEAKTAEQRRLFRTARRRLDRRRYRINLLQELMAAEIEKTDPYFFIRLNNSALHTEDKQTGKYSIFNDNKYTDIDFYKKHPTIYHLRKSLINNPVDDIRLLYLCLHHIIKYRGHFLFEGQKFSDSRNLQSIFKKLDTFITENLGIESIFTLSEYNILEQIFIKSSTLTIKKKKCNEVFSAKDTLSKEIITAFLGGKFKIEKLGLSCTNLDKKSYSFNDNNFEGDAIELEQKLDNDFELIQILKEIYDYSILSKVLKDNDFISSAMVDVYEKHKNDLKKLKQLIREHFKESYNEIFRFIDNKKNNYCSYIGYTKIKTNKQNIKKCLAEDFYKYIKGILLTKKEQLKDDENFNKILNAIESGGFLPKILNMDNGIFPYQINLTELQLILKNAEKYFGFLKETENGLTVSNKIESIFTFKIPYYIGPLNNSHDSSWIVKKSNERILPWNFNETVDKEQSAENFIKRMTNKCTYYYGADVLPKHSMLYAKFDVLNQLNKLKINGEQISVKLKQKIFNELFKQHKRVTDKRIKAFLIYEGLFQKNEEISLSGKDGDFKASLSSYITLKNILGEFLDNNMQIGEDIILWHTLFTDKQMFEKKLLEKYDQYSQITTNITALKGLNFNDFGRLSKNFLTEIIGYTDPSTGEAFNIINALYNKNYNLNELLFNEDYTFKSELEKINTQQNAGGISYGDIKDLYLSPAVKRGVWQSILAVKEYVGAIRKAPDKIFIEVTREKGKKERTVSRRKRLLDLYKNCKKEKQELNDLLNDLNKKTDSDLRQDRLYLYFCQLGRCMYTNECIDLNQLDSNTYDIDHILPKSIIKDDSLNNRVLVKRTANAIKKDNYPLPADWINKNLIFWKILKEKGFITAEKYLKLTRKTELTKDELEGFIARQLVFTSQTAKAVAKLLGKEYVGTKIVYSKASAVSEFRHQFGIIKNRDINDLHHADDAYLNIVVGNVYDTRFSSANSYFYKKSGEQRAYNLETLFNYNIDKAWTADNSQTIKKVKRIIEKNSKLVTSLAQTGSGEFYDQTLYTGKEALFPRKESGPLSNIEKYGGYKSMKTGYFIVVDSLDKRNNIIRTIEAVPTIFINRIEQDKHRLIDICIKYFNLKEPKIIVNKIKIKSLLEVNGSKLYIAGRQGTSILLHNATQWFADGKTSAYINLINKLIKLYDNEYLPKQYSQEEAIIVSGSKRSARKDEVNKTKNLELYNLLVNNLKKPVYKGIVVFKSIYNTLSNSQRFINLNIIEQCKVLIQIIYLFKNNATPSDISILGGSNRSGAILISKNITKQSVKLINQSVTGLFENTVWLSKNNNGV